jgi:hypothetical protein
VSLLVTAACAAGSLAFREALSRPALRPWLVALPLGVALVSWVTIRWEGVVALLLLDLAVVLLRDLSFVGLALRVLARVGGGGGLPPVPASELPRVYG